MIAVERAAKALGIEINILEARAGSLEQTVRFAQDRKASALLLLGSPVLSAEFPRIAAATTAARLPTIALLPQFTGRHRTDLGCPLCYADDERTRRRGLHSAVASSHKTNPRRDAAQRLLRQHDRDRRLCRRRVTPLLSLRRRGRSIIPRKRGLLTGRASGKLLAEEPEHVSERFCCSWRDILTHLPFVRVSGCSASVPVKGDLRIEFVPQHLTSYAGLELVRRYVRKLEIAARPRARAIGPLLDHLVGAL